MVTLVNRAKMTTSTTGTGTITLGSAEDGFQSFADAGVSDGDVVRYTLEDGLNWEVGSGTYSSSGTTLTRTVSESSSAGSAITLSGEAVVFVTAAVGDIQQPPSEGAFVDGDKTKLDGIEANATADQTAGEIKTAYESNANTNAFTDGEQSKLSGIEAGADVTDTANVTAAGALMDSEVANLAAVKSFDPTDYATSAQGNLANTAVQPNDSPTFGSVTVTGTVDGRDVAADGSKLDGIESNADVTDTANVTSAGALMDSEVTNLAQVKAFDSSDYATSAQGSRADSAVQPGDNVSDLTNDAGYTTNTGDITGVTAGDALTGGGTSGTVTLNHADTSSQGSVNNSGTTFIQDVTLDGFGHVTSLGSTTISTRGSAKAFVGVKLSNNHEIYDSFNVSSVTDDGTGDLSDSLTNNFAQAGRITSSQSGGSEVDGNTNSGLAIRGSAGLTTAGGSYSAGYHSGGHGTNDVDYANITQFGDLA